MSCQMSFYPTSTYTTKVLFAVGALCRDTCTAGFSIHGRHARILGQIFDVKADGRGGGLGGAGNTVLEFYWDVEIQF